ncbi:hypothetical protein PoB_006129700 [Plakobranchus ocellatus]|uniref:Uncharacterized protein n=1 Tax=Plakobranchus ocellatus TaxID=259542 RepID=A0AAV4CSD0_9GAST|nr:hypothetical protein PoB_006129700 [Plakobranchus ocellatus]
MVHVSLKLIDRRGLEVLHALSSDQCTYGHLKESLLKRFKFTEEGFRERFCSSVPRSGQDFETFINQLMKLMDRWLESASIKDGFKREEPTDRSTGPAQPANAARNKPTPRFATTLRARVNADSLDHSLYRQDRHNNNSNNKVSTIKDAITEAIAHQIDFLEETDGRTETEAEVITITNEKTTDDPLMAGSSQDRIIAILLSECRQHLPCSPTSSQPDRCHFSQQKLMVTLAQR